MHMPAQERRARRVHDEVGCAGSDCRAGLLLAAGAGSWPRLPLVAAQDRAGAGCAGAGRHSVPFCHTSSDHDVVFHKALNESLQFYLAAANMGYRLAK